MMEYHEYTDEEKSKFRDDPAHHLEFRKEIEGEFAGSFPVFIQGSTIQQSVREQMAAKMAKSLNNDELAKKLVPTFALGCRRFVVSHSPSLTVVYVLSL